jgi:alpha-beta hydrolase superfamily lysophospholipase
MATAAYKISIEIFCARRLASFQSGTLVAQERTLPIVRKIKTITCPVIIFHGDKDKLVPVSNAAYAKKC